MNFASKRAYITKKKVQSAVPEAEEKPEGSGRGRLPSVEGARPRSRSRSLSSISDEELDHFHSDVELCEDEMNDVAGEEAQSQPQPQSYGKVSALACPPPALYGSSIKAMQPMPLMGAPVSMSAYMQAPMPSAAPVPKIVKEEKEEEKASKKKKKKVNSQPVPLSLAVGSAGRKYEQEVDTNVLSLNLSVLKDKTAIATGDAVVCSSCNAILNVHSKISKDLISNEQTWICEFCSTLNKISLEEEEIPKAEELTYVIESAQQAMLKKGGGENITVMFCIDVSGSMCVTQAVTGKMRLKYDKVKKLQDLMKFSDGSYQYTDTENRNATYVSRMQCVQAAIENQLAELAHGAPNRKAGIVTFNNEVVLIGDGSVPPKTFAGDKLLNYEELLGAAQKDSETYMTKSVSATKDDLVRSLEKIEESGQTALGPALVVALGVAIKGTPGSRVIICTDGLANVGLGSVENLSTEEATAAATDFYTKLGALAKERGVIVSIVSIVGEDCRLEMLSPLAELTGGDIIKVDPLNLTKDFASILSDAIIATHVQLKVKIHKGFTFRNENPDNLSQDGSLMTREIGNATEGQEITIEYCTKSSKELKEMKDIDLSKIKALPFQAQIKYVALDGMRCVRLITKQQEVTFDKEEAKKEVDYKMISVNAIQKTAQLAKKGEYRAAQANAHHWGRMMKEAPVYNDYVANAAPLYEAVQEQQWDEFNEDQVAGKGQKSAAKGGKKKKNDRIVSTSHQAEKINYTKMSKK